ncbi:hypothetical protein KJ762_14785 [bacterium]|nr:hypothetical protein [bacterium]MBU1635756.1 hypothetical protein [bacterium]MBU1872860.1 hypothetical protein [bacterium]
MKRKSLIFLAAIIGSVGLFAKPFSQDNSVTIGSDNDKVYYSICALDYCGNSSSYTSSIMYQGTSPLWKTSIVENDTIIYSESDLDGDIQTLHTESDDYWVRISGQRILVGDDETNQHIDQHAYRSYLSFNISSFESDNKIISAVLKIWHFRF